MNPDAPFYPKEGQMRLSDNGIDTEVTPSYLGITIRNYIAIEAMKALIPIDLEETQKVLKATIVEAVAAAAYMYADALIAESNKK